MSNQAASPGELAANFTVVPNSNETTVKPLRIFPVENHPDTLEYRQKDLEMSGHCVQAADSMTKALAELPLADCEVLMSDIGFDADARAANPTPCEADSRKRCHSSAPACEFGRLVIDSVRHSTAYRTSDGEVGICNFFFR